MWKTGDTLNERYRLDSEIGQGAMGVIYRAHDHLLVRDVAIKILSKAALGSAGRARLLHEAQAAARLNHPNIVSVYDAGQTDGQTFIVMELVEGHSLFAHSLQGFDEIITIARQICAALQHAHSNDIVHRDLKPENVLLTAAGLVKLTDFGLARSIASRLTSEGTIEGTVYYLAPEAALGQPVDGRSDLYSLGVMLYEMAAGQLPFTAERSLEIISQHLYSSIVPPSTLNQAIPPALDALIVRMMSKRPEDRPETAAAVGLVLEAIADTPSQTAGAATPPSLLDRIARGKLVGRAQEMAELTAHWRRAASGEGHVLLVSGEPGIGKTRLVRELVALAEVSQATVLTGECYAEGGPPYAPVIQIIRDALSRPNNGLVLPEYALPSLVTLCPDLAPRYPDPVPSPLLDPQAEQQRLFESMVTLSTTLAAQAPLLLFVEDIHWADSGTLFLLRHLARRTRRQRVLIVMTYREIELAQACCLQDVLVDLNRERLATRLKLTRLGRAQTGAMLAAMLTPSGEIDPHLLEAIYRETEGNPFYVEEVCKVLVEENRLTHERGRWLAREIEDMAIPQSVQLTIQARLSWLPEIVQDVLRTGAILGREFDYEVLQQASQVEEDTLIDALETAERAQIITEQPRDRGPGVTFSFVHALIPSTLRDNISSLRRRRLHRQAARALEAVRPDDWETLAFQYEQAGDIERARDYYTRAGDRALALYANQEAERHYRAALELSESTSGRAGLLAGLGESLFWQGRYTEAIQAWQEAGGLYRGLENHDQVARLYARCARAAWYNGDISRGLELCREGLEAVPTKPVTPGLAALVHETGRACFFNQRADEALSLNQQALQMARELGLVDVQADALATLGVLPNQPPAAAEQALRQAIELAESSGLLLHAIRAHTNLGAHLASQGDLAGHMRQLRHALELIEQTGNVAWKHTYLANIADIALARADLQTVEEILPELRRLLDDIPDPEAHARFTDALEAYLQRLRGNWTEALRLMHTCQEEARKAEASTLLEGLNTNLAEMLMELGRLDEAEAPMLEALETLLEPAEGSWIWPYCVFSTLRARQGRVEEARFLLQKARKPDYPAPYHLDRLAFLWAEAELAAAEQRWPEALSLLDQAIGVATRLGSRWHQARLLRDQAEVYLARGKQGDGQRGRTLLQQARDMFRQIQSPGYAGLVEQRLQDLD